MCIYMYVCIYTYIHTHVYMFVHVSHFLYPAVYNNLDKTGGHYAK